MTSLAPANPSDSNSETMLNQNRSFDSNAGRNAQLQAISRSLTKQRVEVVPVSYCVCREPDIIYLKQPILNSVRRDAAYSVKAYAKFPDDWLENKLEEKSTEIPIATNRIAEDSGNKPIVNELMRERNSSAGAKNDQDTVNLDGKLTNREKVSGKNATQSCAKDVKTNKVGTQCNNSIKVESTVTNTVVASEGVSFKATVNASTKLTLQKNFTGASSLRYFIQAPVHVKIVLQGPMSSSPSVIEFHSVR